MTTESLVDRLAAHRTIGIAPREELHWIATHSTYRMFHARQIVSLHEAIVNELYILLTGRISHIWFFAAGQFFTTKAAGEGRGLGLDIVRRIVAWHNGQVDVDNTPGRTEFLVKLPCSEEKAGLSSAAS